MRLPLTYLRGSSSSCGMWNCQAVYGIVPSGNTIRTIMTKRFMMTQKQQQQQQPLGLDVMGARTALIQAGAICFDVDSTVITEEGIDVLAAHLGKAEQVAALTRRAMEGADLKFEDALQQRLELLQPSQHNIAECLKQHPLKLSPFIPELIEKLHSMHKDVYLVSGGFRLMIAPVAQKLNIADERIYANTLLFDGQGEYMGFDEMEPTSRDMGKAKALEYILAQNPHYQSIVMVGDGATDLQAKPPAAAFIGYGGVSVRSKVQREADWFVTDFADVLKVLEQY